MSATAHDVANSASNAASAAARAAFGLPPLEPRFDELYFEQSA